MRRFLIERELPGAGRLAADDLRGIAAKSCGVLQELGPMIQWVESYVTEDKITCVYLAKDEAILREHAARGGFPVTRISEVAAVIDRMTAETNVPLRR